MVNVVDVEISLDNFVRAFGHPPNEKELALMMRLKAQQQEKQKKSAAEEERQWKLSETSKEVAREAQENKPLKDSIGVSPRAMMVNKMLHYGLEVNQIADVLGVCHVTVLNVMQRFKLPRENVYLYKPK